MEFLILIGCVALLMYGMKVMSEGLQKMLLTGAFITTSIQSSTATTVMTVSFVSAGLLTLSQAISVIMGANIGTTATAWIMVLGSFDMRLVVYSAIIIAIALIYTKRSINTGEFLMGLALMLLGLSTLKTNAIEMDLGHNERLLSFLTGLSGWGYGSYFLFLLIGGLLTCAVQSSAAIMAITMTLCSTGALPIDMGIALVMGENIGTTITSNVVAMSASVQAQRAARAHLIFNLFGVVWVLCIYKYFVGFVCGLVGCDPTARQQDMVTLNAALAAFHTAFNVCNVLILIWFIGPMEKLVCLLVPAREGENEEDDMKLKYISGGLLSTAELSVLEAKKEVNVFISRLLRMYGMVQDLLQTTKVEEFNKLYSRIEKYEGITDRMEIEIADYLTQVSEGRLSVESKLDIQRMMRVCSELESIGDSCFNMARTMKHKRQYGTEDFTEAQYQHIHNMMGLVGEALAEMQVAIQMSESRTVSLNKNYNTENEINNYRDQLKNQNIIDVNDKLYDYQMGVFYMDIISECEKLGDYIINVLESSGLKK